MKHALLTMILFFSLFAPAQAQIVLDGNLQEDSGKPVPNTKINVAGGPSDITDSIGQFKIQLPRDFIEGERVIIQVLKKDWWINYPLDGQWNLPNLKYQSVHTTKVIIVPKGSKKLWSHERIEKYIANLSDELAKYKKERNKPKQVDFTRYLDQYAKKFGFTVDEVRDAFDQWAKKSDPAESARTKALREYYLQNFSTAAALFEESALARRKKREEVQRNEYNDWKDAGSSYAAERKFKESLKDYQEAQKIVSKETFPLEWADLRLLIGNVKLRFATEIEGEEANDLLREASQACNEALEVYTPKEYPLEWAWTQRDLGGVFVEQAKRTQERDAMRLLEQATTAMGKALEVFTREEYPLEWAIAQDSLGITLREQGLRSRTIIHGASLLDQAIRKHKSALEVFTRDEYPLEWAGAQENLAIALMERGLRARPALGGELLEEATTAMEKALEVFTREEYPLEWAGTQYNRGLALMGQATRIMPGQRELLEGAITAYKKALEVYTQSEFPRQWAVTQKGLRDATKLRCQLFKDCSD